MARYCVTIPIAGSCTVVVEAESERAAIEVAWEEGGDPSSGRDLEWEFYSSLVDGNVLNAPQNTIEVWRDDEDV